MTIRDEKPPDAAGQRLAVSLLSVLGSKGVEPPRIEPPPPKPKIIEVTAPPDRGYVEQPGEEDEPPDWHPYRTKPAPRRHSAQVKADAVALALSIGRGGVAKAARRFQVSPQTIKNWLRAARGEQAPPPPPPKPEPPKSAPVELKITIEGLDEYINRRVDERLLKRLRKILGEDD